MKTFFDLADLAKRATGPDRELDVLIGETVNLIVDGEVSLRQSLRLSGLEETVKRADMQQVIWSTALPRYTASYDAIMTLAPTNTKRRVEFGTYSDGTAWAYVLISGEAGAVGEADEAANEVLALLTAMLKVRGEMAQ